MNPVSIPSHPIQIIQGTLIFVNKLFAKKILKKIMKHYGLLFQFALDNRNYKTDMFCLHFWNLETTHYKRLK